MIILANDPSFAVGIEQAQPAFQPGATAFHNKRRYLGTRKFVSRNGDS